MLPKLKLASLLSKGLTLKLTSSAACIATGKLILAKKLAKQLKLASTDVTVASASALSRPDRARSS